MASRTVRRTVVAIASTVIAAAGLLATGGSASAATYPSGSHSSAVSAVRTADDHHGDRHNAFNGRGSDDRGHWDRDQGGRRYLVRDHDGGHYWIRYDDRGGYRVRIDEGRRLWVLDQLRWAGDDGYTFWGLEYHGRSHR
ncbi:hypothetical protein ACWCRF_27355 [Streptomyces sp. NPDC002405]